MSIHTRVKQIQIQSGFSLRKFEQECGINRNVIAIAIKGEKSLSHTSILKIHKRFPEYTLDWIFNGYEPLFEYMCDYLELTKYELAKKLGFATLEVINNGRNEMGPDLTERVLQLCPHISRSWLLKGVGEMLVGDEIRESVPSKQKRIPTIHRNIQQTFSLQLHNLDFIGQLPISIWEVSGEFSGKHYCFEVSSDSMDDGSRNSIVDGDWVLCREIEPTLWEHKLDQKDWVFVILHKTHGLVLKKITAHDNTSQTISCRSLNVFYKDVDYALNQVQAIYNVVGFKRNLRL